MFRKAKKRAPPAPALPTLQSRADTYKIGTPDFNALSRADRSNPKNGSLNSVSSNSTTSEADDGSSSLHSSHSGAGSCDRSGNKSQSLTFSTFLGTPQMSRKNGGGRDGCGAEETAPNIITASKPPKPTSAHHTNDDVPSSSSSVKSAKKSKKEGGLQKKQSVISKMKQVLTTPRLGRKPTKDVHATTGTGGATGAASTSGSGTSGFKSPPPPPPKRTSSLTRDDERKKFGQIDLNDNSELNFVNISDFEEDPKANYELVANPNAAPPSETETSGANENSEEPTYMEISDIPIPASDISAHYDNSNTTLSLEIASIDVSMSQQQQQQQKDQSNKPEADDDTVDDSERCDTLQSVDYISDDEASVRSLSSNSVSNSMSSSQQPTISTNGPDHNAANTDEQCEQINGALAGGANSLQVQSANSLEDGKTNKLVTQESPIKVGQSQSHSIAPGQLASLSVKPSRSSAVHLKNESSTDNSNISVSTPGNYMDESINVGTFGTPGYNTNKSLMSVNTTVWNTPTTDAEAYETKKPASPSTNNFYTGTFITELSSFKSSSLLQSPDSPEQSTFRAERVDSAIANVCSQQYSDSPDNLQTAKSSPVLSTFINGKKQSAASKSPKLKMFEASHNEGSSNITIGSRISSDDLSIPRDMSIPQDITNTDYENTSSLNNLAANRSLEANIAVGDVSPSRDDEVKISSCNSEDSDNIIDLTIGEEESATSPIAPPRKRRNWRQQTEGTPSPQKSPDNESITTDGPNSRPANITDSPGTSFSKPALPPKPNDKRLSSGSGGIPGLPTENNKRHSSPSSLQSPGAKPTIGPKPQLSLKDRSSLVLSNDDADSTFGTSPGGDHENSSKSVNAPSQPEIEKIAKSPSRDCARQHRGILMRQSATQLHASDSDSVTSSSGYEHHKPPNRKSSIAHAHSHHQRSSSKIERSPLRGRKSTDDESVESTTTDDDIAMLSAAESTSSELMTINSHQQHRLTATAGSVGARTTTPTLELYHSNAWDIGPESRCLPSPRPHDHRVLMEDDNESREILNTFLDINRNTKRKVSPHPNALTKSLSITSAGPQRAVYTTDIAFEDPHAHTPYLSRNPGGENQYQRSGGSNHNNKRLSPSHRAEIQSLDADMEIADSFMNANPLARNLLQTFESSSPAHQQRSSTPNIDHIRHLQKQKSAANDIVVDNLRYRPSTPLIGGQGYDLTQGSPRKDLLLIRSRGFPGLASIRDCEEIVSPRKQPLIATRPHSFDVFCTGNGQPDVVGGGQQQAIATRANHIEQWKYLPGSGPELQQHQQQQRRPPSPILRAKVNSVLDNLISKPAIGRGPNTPGSRRSLSADHVLCESNNGLLSLPPEPSPRFNTADDPATAMPTPRIHRPPSPFDRFSPRPGYLNESDIDIEFEYQGSALKGCTDLTSGVTVSYQSPLVPPLNLDFTRQKSEEEITMGAGAAGTHTTTDRSGVDMKTPLAPPGNSEALTALQSEHSYNLNNYIQNLQPQNDHHSNTRNTNTPTINKQPVQPLNPFPGYDNKKETLSHQDSMRGDDHTPDISSACLELSNPVSSDSEDEKEQNKDTANLGWQLKPTESWSTRDLCDWCRSQGHAQMMSTFKVHGITGQDVMRNDLRHLVDMGLQEEAEREFFMNELHKLRLRPTSAASLWRLKQTSMKRRTLEASSELLKERLYNLQQESTDQNQRIDTSIEALIKQRQQTDQLLGQGHPDYNVEQQETGRESTKLHNGLPGIPTDVPLSKWTADDVEMWLKASGLERFAPAFQAHNVRGRDLAAINLQFLDELSIHSTLDRELLLSKLYDLQRPSLEDMTGGIAGVNPAVPADMQPPSSRLRPVDSMDAKVLNDGYSRSNGVDAISPTKNSSLQSKLKDIVSPRKFGSRQEEKTLRITHDITGSSGYTDVRISEATTSAEVIQKVLDDLEVIDDLNLFYLSVTVPAQHTDRGETELGKFECPLTLARQTTGSGNLRFELRKRLGIMIKAICHMPGMKTRGKGFRVSPFSTSPELLQVALRKFRLSHVDASLFCLLPVNKETGDVRLMADPEIVQDCETDTFMLTHQENVDHLLTTTDDTLPLLEQSKQILRRNSSLNSHGSSALSQSSEASQGSDVVKPRVEQLETLEAKMADIEASLASNLQLEAGDEGTGLQQQQQQPDPHAPPSSCQQSRQMPPPGGRRKNQHHQYQPQHIDITNHRQAPVSVQNARYVTPKKQKLPSSEAFTVTQDFQPDDQLELIRELALLKETIQERDAAISTLRYQNEALQTQSKQVDDLKKQLTTLNLHHDQQEQRLTEQLNNAHQTLEVKHRQLEHANQALQAEQQQRLREAQEVEQQRSLRRRGPQGGEDDDSDSGRETNRSTREVTPGSSPDLRHDVEQLEQQLLAAQNEARGLEDELADSRTRQQRALHDSRISGDTVNVQLLTENCSITEAKLLQVKQRHADLYARLELTKKEHEKAQKAKAGPCLYDTLSPGPAQCIVCVELSSSDGPGFIPGRNGYDRIIIKHVVQGLPLCKGDRLLEVNGQRVFHLDDQSLQQLLRGLQTPVKVVVIRDIQQNQDGGRGDDDTAEKIEALKDDLSLAMIEVESVQQENQDLTHEVERLKTSNRRLHEENEQMLSQLQQMKEQMADPNQSSPLNDLSQSTGSGDRSTFIRRDELSAQKKLRFGDDFQTDTTQPNSIHNISTSPGHQDEVIAYDRLDASVPLWEGLRKASKKEVLQVLKDHIMETSQQKSYLDRLMAVVIDNAPDLLDHVDNAAGMEEDTMCWKPHSEEFC